MGNCDFSIFDSYVTALFYRGYCSGFRNIIRKMCNVDNYNRRFLCWYKNCVWKKMVNSDLQEMTMKKRGEEKRYKHKLNMLEPGTKMLKCIGILSLIGILLYVFQFRIIAFCVWAVSGIIFAILLIFLAIEAHQDNVMNEITMKENKKNGENWFEYS